MPDRSRCPQCGERVSPFAAGCAVCGADLDPSRWDKGPGLGNRIGSTLTAVTYGYAARWVLGGLVLVVVLAYLGVF
jgi:hypothetical protein